MRTDDIQLTGVTLVYPGREQPALDEVSLTIRPGERIILTGRSGAGKSSLLKLLLRFTEPTSGRISAGRHELGEIPADGWLRQLAWVPQHPHLFTATIADNIALGQPGTPRHQVEAAGRLAGADDFIRQLPDGYDTFLAEGARSLRRASARSSPWPGRSSAMPSCCSWTSRPPTSTRPVRLSSLR